jgi:hypothetical protein
MARPKGVAETRPRRTAAKKLLDSARHQAAGDIEMHEMMRQIALMKWRQGDLDGALIAADKAAPYFAPKLSSTDARVRADVSVAQPVDAPPPETREEWIARRRREVQSAALLGATAGSAD